MCGKTTLLLEGTQTPFVRERYCCKTVDSVFLSLDDRKAELYWKTTVALINPFEGLVAQRTTPLTTNQEIAGSNPGNLRDRLFTLMFLVFGETEQDYPIDRHQKNFAATKRKNDQSARTFTVLQRLIMNVYPRMLEQEKKTAGTNARFPKHRLAKTLLIDKETVHRSVDSVGNQHCH